MTAFLAGLALILPVPYAAGAGHAAIGEGYVRSATPATPATPVRPDRRVAVVRPYRAKLERMAWCESTGRWHIAGLYRGGLQFDYRTWASVGGRGDPAAASKLEQMYRAVLLIRRRGYAPWPVCGSR